MNEEQIMVREPFHRAHLHAWDRRVTRTSTSPGNAGPQPHAQQARQALRGPTLSNPYRAALAPVSGSEALALDARTASDAALASPPPSTKRPKRPKAPKSPGWVKVGWPSEKGKRALDLLRQLWMGADGTLRQPTTYGPTFLDREARVLTLLLLLAHCYRRGTEVRLVVSGYLLNYLLQRAHMSKSDWCRALDVLVDQAGVLSIEGGATRTNQGEVISQINDYVIHVERLIFWSSHRRPKEWPKAPSRKAGVGPLERAVEEARDTLGLDPAEVVEDLRRARRADRACGQVEAAVQRRQKDALALATKGSALLASDGQVEAALARVAALRHQAGLDAAPIALFRERASAAVRGAPAPGQPVPPEQLCLPFPDAQRPCAGRPEVAGEAVPRAGQPAAAPEVSPVISATSEDHRKYSEQAEPVPAEATPTALGPASPPSEPTPTNGDGARPAPGDGAPPSEPSDAELIAFAVAHESANNFCRKVARRRRHGTFLTPPERDRLIEIVGEVSAEQAVGPHAVSPGPKKTIPGPTGAPNRQPFAAPGSKSDWFARNQAAVEAAGDILHPPDVPRTSAGGDG